MTDPIPEPLSFTLDPADERPLPVQVSAQLRALVESGLLRPGDRLPASRRWAQQLGVSRGTVVSAYEQLIAEGYLVAEPGSRTCINPRLAALLRQEKIVRQEADISEPKPLPAGVKRPHRQLLDLRSGLPDTHMLETPAWRAAWRYAARHVGEQALPIAGDLGLRQQLAEHLRIMRGLIITPEEILITGGARDGLAMLLLSRGVLQHRQLRVGVEEPGYPALRSVARRMGAQVVALPIDQAGLRTSELPTSGLDIVIVTPSHQYPLGGSLPLERRLELLRWARERDVLVVEDDYDSELRYVGRPLPTLAALDTGEGQRLDTVLTLGTFSKTITPALGAGYVIAGVAHREELLSLRQDLDTTVPAIVQVALRSYLRSGELRRHTGRMRRHYSQRRDELIRRLAQTPQVQVHAMEGGLHAIIELTHDHDAPQSPTALESQLIAHCAAHGLQVQGMTSYWQHNPQRAGLVIGYGALSDAEFTRGLLLLQESLATWATPAVAHSKLVNS